MKVTLSLYKNNTVLRFARGEQSNYKLLYLGKSFEKIQFIQKHLIRTEYIGIDVMINQKAWELTRAYIDWVGETGKPYGDSLIWWTSNIAEKNTSTSDLFLHLCYIEIVGDLVKDGKNNLFILVEDWALFLTIVSFLKENNVNTDIIPSTRSVFLTAILHESILFLSSWLKGICILFYNHLAACLTRNFKQMPISYDRRPNVLIHTCIDEDCLGKDGSFFDRYFGRLPIWLKEQGFNVATVVWPFNFKRSIFSVFRWFRARDEQFIIPEDYFSLKDYPGAILCITKQLFVPKEAIRFNKIDTHTLLLKERFRQASNVRKARFLLYQSMVKRLRKEGYNLNYYLEMFENMSSEKPVAKALHYYYPNAKLYGFQHSTIYPFMLMYSLSRYQYKNCSSIFPDNIICNGKTWVNVLSQRGFPVEIIKLGPALRYQHLFDASENVDMRKREKIVLVALAIEYDTSVSILKKIREISQGSPIRIAIKVHPMMDKEKLIDLLSWGLMPENMFWADGDLKDWLYRSACVVGSATAVILESLYGGTPVVVVGQNGCLEMSPLAWWSRNIPMLRTCYDTDDIRERILYWTSIEPQEAETVLKNARFILNDCFIPWDESLLSNIFSYGNDFIQGMISNN